MKWFRVFSAVASLVFFSATSAADDIKVQSNGSGRVTVKVEPPRKGFLERMRERRQPQVIMLPAAVAATPTQTIPAELPKGLKIVVEK